MRKASAWVKSGMAVAMANARARLGRWSFLPDGLLKGTFVRSRPMETAQRCTHFRVIQASRARLPCRRAEQRRGLQPSAAILRVWASVSRVHDHVGLAVADDLVTGLLVSGDDGEGGRGLAVGHRTPRRSCVRPACRSCRRTSHMKLYSP